MNKKSKYLIERWDNNMQLALRYDKFTVEGAAELIFWKRILKNEVKNGAISKYKITKIE